MTYRSALTINGQPIPFEQTLRHLKAAGKLQLFLGEIASQYILEQAISQAKLVDPTPEVIAQAILQLRQDQDLLNDDLFRAWLADQDLTAEEFQSQAAFSLKLDQFITQLTAPKLLEHFIDHKLQLDQVVLSRIAVTTVDLAEELKSQLSEAEASFEQLARDYSCTDERLTNGMMGFLSRGEAQDLLGLDLFQISPGEVLGPLPWDCYWCLVRVEALLPASFDDPQLQHELRQQIFDQWLEHQLEAVTVEL